MTRPPKIVVSLRVGRDLWRDAQAKADERGEVLSEEIRKFLHRYVRRTK
ncbi:MAG: hypothetical protein ACXVXP_12970 [Mycobacteriaceae bacterium]